MPNKKSLLSLGLLLIVALTLAGFPAITYAQQGSSGQPNFAFVNYIGQEVILDLDDVTYTVPGTATAPNGGRLELQLAPGEHKYAANVPGVDTGSGGTFIIEPGGYVGKAARLEKTNARLDRDGNVLEGPKDYVFIFDFDPFAAPIAPAPVTDTWQPRAAAAGQSSIAWTNYTGEELTVDLNGTIYKVPPAANNIPGRLQIDVAPGLYRYTASVPNGSLNGELNAVAGQVTGLNISAKLQPEPEFDIGEPSPLPLPVDLLLSQEDLTARAVPASGTSPAEVPASQDVPAPTNVQPAATSEGLRINNYAGETLIFTINNQAYLVPSDVTTTLPLPPGLYNFTASLPFVAANGTVDLMTNQGAELSIATNVNRDVLNVYQIQ
jgi:hypothetical protein